MVVVHHQLVLYLALESRQTVEIQNIETKPPLAVLCIRYPNDSLTRYTVVI